LYEQSLLGKNNNDKIDEIGSSGGSIGQRYYSSVIVVKAAHMEIATPSILDTIRDIIVTNKVMSNNMCTILSKSRKACHQRRTGIN
jgi:hypothetical protein